MRMNCDDACTLGTRHTSTTYTYLQLMNYPTKLYEIKTIYARILLSNISVCFSLYNYNLIGSYKPFSK